MVSSICFFLIEQSYFINNLSIRACRVICGLNAVAVNIASIRTRRGRHYFFGCGFAARKFAGYTALVQHHHTVR